MKQALTTPVEIKDTILKGNRISQVFVGEHAKVSVNPDSNILIQVNPNHRKYRNKDRYEKITDSDYKIIKKYNININENMNIDDILDEIEAKMFEMGFEENDEINKDGIELERLYDNIFHNNKEV